MINIVGETILHYKIIEQIGQGGMGVVYKAEDKKLRREVAIKFLPQHIAVNQEERLRFEIEAQAAASLNHPNIATIYAIEESDNDTFIVMEYIDGIEIKDRIKSGTISEDNVINFAIQIAEGLQAAHKKGIVHRDIKSQNIMITSDSKVKIMDFGLAKIKGGTQVTKIGSTVGTAAYMSPEQATGNEVDHRTDIWSFGVVLYEMLIGKLPFKGDYDQAIIYSILNEEPEFEIKSSSKFRSIILKALAKNTSARYQSMTELLHDLNNLKDESFTISKSFPKQIHSTKKKSQIKRKFKWLVPAALILLTALIISYNKFFSGFFTGESSSSGKKMIVVLPFKNLGSSEDEYFADGITGEITSKLSGLSGLGVIAHSSALHYKNTNKSLKQIGDELSVQYVLEGTIQWEKLDDGKRRIRVNPELINIENATQLWSKPYQADFSNVFTLQSEIASTVADAMNLKLIGSEHKNLESTITRNSEAYDLYLKARYYSQDITNEKNTRIAAELLEKSIKLDSVFAQAYASLSTVQSNMHWSYFERSQENLNNSRANALRALDINPELPEAYVAMGDFYYHGMLDYSSALYQYNKALEINNTHFDAYNGIAFVYRRQGKLKEAIENLKKNFEVNPRDFQTAFSIGETYILLREYKTAFDYLDKANLLAPDATPPYEIKARGYLLGYGDIKKARSLIQNAMERKIGLDSYFFANILYICDLMEHNYEGALKDIKNITEVNDQYYYKSEYLYLAELYGLMGNKDLEKTNYTAAKTLLLEKIKKNPDDSRLHSSLGIAYAGLGEKENAVREGNKGYELLPVTKDAWRGSFRLLELAKIYVMIGEYESALDRIEELLGMHTDAISPWLLKLDPAWKSLRNNPRFQKLVNN